MRSSATEAKVPNIERCVGFGEVTTTAGPRQGMVLTPCLPGRNISVKNGCGNPRPLESQEEDRMERFMATAVRVLEAGVAGVDVQVGVLRKYRVLNGKSLTIRPLTRDR